TNSPYARRLLAKEKRFFCVRSFSKNPSLSCGRKGIDETPEWRSTRRLSSRPRKEKCIRAAAGQVTCSITSATNVEVTSQFTSTTRIKGNTTYEKGIQDQAKCNIMQIG